MSESKTEHKPVNRKKCFKIRDAWLRCMDANTTNLHEVHNHQYAIPIGSKQGKLPYITALTFY